MKESIFNKILGRGVFLILTLATFSVPASVSAESIDDIAVKIFNASPELQSLRLSNEAAAAGIVTEGNLPDPEISGEYLAAPAGEKDRWGVGVSWSLDWPGVYAARRRVAEGEVKSSIASEYIFRCARRIEIKRLLLDYILASRKITLLSEIAAANDSVAVLTEKGKRGGEMTRLDLSKLRIERLSIDSQRLEAENAMIEAANSLSSLYGADCSSLLDGLDCLFPEIQVPSAEQLAALSAVSPAVAEAEAALDVARLSESVAIREGLPSLSIGYRHAFEDGNHFNGGEVGISIPVFSNHGMRKAAKAAIKAAEYDVQAVRNESGLAIDRTLRRLTTLNNGVQKLTEALTEADDTALLNKAYEARVITLIELLNERNYFLEARLAHLDLLHALANARLDLDALLP